MPKKIGQGHCYFDLVIRAGLFRQMGYRVETPAIRLVSNDNLVGGKILKSGNCEFLVNLEQTEMTIGIFCLYWPLDVRSRAF